MEKETTAKRQAPFNHGPEKAAKVRVNLARRVVATQLPIQRCYAKMIRKANVQRASRARTATTVRAPFTGREPATRAINAYSRITARRHNLWPMQAVPTQPKPNQMPQLCRRRSLRRMPTVRRLRKLEVEDRGVQQRLRRRGVENRHRRHLLSILQRPPLHTEK